MVCICLADIYPARLMFTAVYFFIMIRVFSIMIWVYIISNVVGLHSLNMSKRFRTVDLYHVEIYRSHWILNELVVCILHISKFSRLSGSTQFIYYKQFNTDLDQLSLPVEVCIFHTYWSRLTQYVWILDLSRLHLLRIMFS